jgi:hypothetical protein
LLPRVRMFNVRQSNSTRGVASEHCLRGGLDARRYASDSGAMIKRARQFFDCLAIHRAAVRSIATHSIATRSIATRSLAARATRSQRVRVACLGGLAVILAAAIMVQPDTARAQDGETNARASAGKTSSAGRAKTVSDTADQTEETGPRSEAQQLLDALEEAPNAGTAAHIERSLLQAWTRSGSDTVDLLMGRAAEAMETKEYPVALELLTTVVEIKPDYAEGWNRRATLYYLMDEYALSVSDIRQTLVIEPRHFGALSGLGLILQSMGRKKSALTAFEAALAVHPFLDSASSAAEELEAEVNGIPM